MAQITVKDTAGKKAGTVELDDAVFGVQPNVPLMHQVVTAQLANRRSGSQSTKTRSDVRGGGAKPYRQKGTGNARQGSTNSPHYTGGGLAHAPKPRSYAQRTPKKMIRLALRSALSDRAADGKVVVVDDWGFAAPKTRDAKAALVALGVEGRALVVVDRLDAPVALSFRNLPEVQLIKSGELNAYDVLCNDWIVFTSDNLPTSRATAPLVEDDVAIHAMDPAEGVRSDEGNEVTASAPDRSDDDTEAGVASVSEQPESPERVSSDGDHSE